MRLVMQLVMIRGGNPPFMYLVMRIRTVAVPRMEAAPEALEDEAVAGPVDEPAAGPIPAETEDMEVNEQEVQHQIACHH